MAVLSTELPLHRLGAEAYGRIVDSGALDEQRVELLDGIIIEMSPHSATHAELIRRLTAHLGGATGCTVSVQLPLQVAPDSLPEPDLALVGTATEPGQHPSTGALVVEVSASSHAIDRGRKAELYAAAGIPTYWLVDVPARTVEVRTDPSPHGYRRLETLDSTAVVASPVDGVEALSVAALFDGV